ncbi:MAG: hypothetical protein WD490_04915 [Opitutales bacterium]
MEAEKSNAESSAHRHEHSDVPIEPVLVVLAGLVALAIVIHVGLWFLLIRWTDRTVLPEAIRIDSGVERLSDPEPPRLQVSPPRELAAWKVGEEAELNSYSWADRQNKIVRVPIDRALQMAVAQGLPAREAGGTGEGDKSGLTPLELRQQRVAEPQRKKEEPK